MTEDFREITERQVGEVRSINRELIEKALRMRCVGYISQVKARLLTETIFEFDQSKKSLQKVHQDIMQQRELVATQKSQLERANQELEDIKRELESRVAQRTEDLHILNKELQQEVQQRQQAEADSREREAFFRAVINSADANIAVLDHTGTIVAVNEAWKNFAEVNSDGVQVKDYVGDNYLRVCANSLGDSTARAALDGLTAVLNGNKAQFSLEYDCHSPKEKRWFSMRALPLRTRNGGAVVYHINVSHLKAVEEELRDNRSRLEELVLARTAELSQVIEELESYSYSIAHDLRSPLRSITGFSQVLLEEAGKKLNTEEKENLQRIINAGKTMANLIDDILALARVTRDKIQRRRVNLSAIADDIIARLKGDFPQRAVTVHIQPEVYAAGDERLLRLVMENLLSNAWKYTQLQPDARIDFNATVGDEGMIYAVRDNGIGLDMHHAKNLYRPFYRLHNAEQFDGTGIGLATVKRIVQRHGGRTWIEGSPGQGATVYFTLAVAMHGGKEQELDKSDHEAQPF